MFKRSTIKDARGRRIDFQVNFDWSEARKKFSRRDLLTLSKIFHEDIKGSGLDELIWTSNLGSRDILNHIVNAIPWAVAIVVFRFLYQPDSTWFRNIFDLVIFTLCFALYFMLVEKWRCRSLSLERPFPQAALRFGYCAACLYDLQQLTPDETDGCTVCPECGGAWKLP